MIKLIQTKLINENLAKCSKSDKNIESIKISLTRMKVEESF